MFFDGNVGADYINSKLSQIKLVFKFKSFLIVTNNVKIEDTKGTMFADKLYFDIKNKPLKLLLSKITKLMLI